MKNTLEVASKKNPKNSKVAALDFYVYNAPWPFRPQRFWRDSAPSLNLRSLQ